MLIRKDFKPTDVDVIVMVGLRVLLIRKDFKHVDNNNYNNSSLRVLLIRKDFKLMLKLATTLLV